MLAAELDDEGNKVGEFEDTPDGFGRIAATTAKQIMLQRLRDAEDDIRFGEFSGKEGDIISGIIQQGRNPDDVMVDLGKLEALLPVGERVPGERYEHGTRIKCLVVSVRKGMRGPQITLSRSHPNLVKKLFALEVPEIADGTVEIAAIAREAGHRTKIAVKSTRPGVNAKGACIGPMGQRVRNVMSELHGEKIDIVDWSEDPAEHGRPRALAGPGHLGRDRRPRGALGARRRARLPAVAGDRQGGPERPPRRPADRLADRHPLRRGRQTSRAPPVDAGAAWAAARPRGGVPRFDIRWPSALGLSSVASEHILLHARIPDPHGPGPDLRRMSEAGRQERVVAGDRRLGCGRPAGRRTRSDGHRTRPGGAPAPHGRVLRPRGAAEGVRPGPAGHDRDCPAHRWATTSPRTHDQPLIDRQKLEQQLMSTR